MTLVPQPRPFDAPKLIALCGAIGAGKSSVANILTRSYGYCELSFATRLKKWAHALFEDLGVETRHFFGTQADKAEPLPQVIGPTGEARTGRQILEILGTEGCRAIMPTIWTTLALIEANQIVREGYPVVISDARFANEFAAVREAGGVVWEVVKVGGEQRETGHKSDTEWRSLPKDGVILARAGDMDGLATEVASLLALGGKRHAELFASQS